MLKINKENEPEFLLQYKSKSSPKTWKDYDSEIKERLKNFILEKEQGKYCAYCEKTIYEISEAHIEHIEPRDKFPKLFQEYNNIIISCNYKHTCGMSKGNDYNEYLQFFLDDKHSFPDLIKYYMQI